MVASISCLITDQNDQFLTPNGWGEIDEAVIYFPHQASLKIKDMLFSDSHTAYKKCFLIQNEKFDYYNEGLWVYDLKDAKHYTRAEAEAIAFKINSDAA
jgi:hypothetical protein